MNAVELFKTASLFEKAAQEKSYDFDLRNKLINSRPMPGSFSFREVANVVMQDLTNIDRNEQDAGITNASHALQNILDNTAVPTAQELLNAATESFNIIKEKTPNNLNSIKVANYLVSLVKLLINKYLNNNSGSPQKQEDQKGIANMQSPSNEGTSAFLQRVYRLVKSNKELTDADLAEWEKYKNFYIKRLNGLNSVKEKTPRQKEEYFVLQVVLNKLRSI